MHKRVLAARNMHILLHEQAVYEGYKIVKGLKGQKSCGITVPWQKKETESSLFNDQCQKRFKNGFYQEWVLSHEAPNIHTHSLKVINIYNFYYLCLCLCLCLCLSLSVYIYSADTLGKGINPVILSPAIGLS